MIHPSELNLSLLPWLPLEAKSAFPRQPAIYFAIDSQGSIQYIGRSNDVRGRWKNHHRYEELAAIGGVKIVYLFIEAPELLPEVEAALISWFQPSLNVMGLGRQFSAKTDKPMRISYVKDFPDTGKLIRGYRQKSVKSLAELSAEAGISVPHWNRIENEKVGELPLTTLRGIEKALDVDLGVRFDDAISV